MTARVLLDISQVSLEKGEGRHESQSRCSSIGHLLTDLRPVGWRQASRRAGHEVVIKAMGSSVAILEHQPGSVLTPHSILLLIVPDRTFGRILTYCNHMSSCRV